MRLTPGRMDCALEEGNPGCSLAESLDPGLMACDPLLDAAASTLRARWRETSRSARVGVRWRGRGFNHTRVNFNVATRSSATRSLCGVRGRRGRWLVGRRKFACRG